MDKFIITQGDQKHVTVRFTLDKYTKTVLSVIALCLLLIVTNIYFSPATLEAQQTTQDVNIKYVNGQSLWGNELPVNLKQVNGRSISGDNLPVDIQSLRGRDLWDDKLPIDIKSVNGSSIFGDEVPVKIK
jgi:hypothetical protein